MNLYLQRHLPLSFANELIICKVTSERVSPHNTNFAQNWQMTHKVQPRGTALTCNEPADFRGSRWSQFHGLTLMLAIW